MVCDDPGLHSSQNEQDTRLFARFAGVPVLEPSDAQEAHDFTKLAFEISEAFDTPVIVRSTTRLSHTRSAVRVGPRMSVAAKGFIDAPSKTVTIPANARRLHPKLIEREAKLARYLEASPLTRWEKGDTRFGIVTGSTAYLYVKEVAPDASILKLGAAYPLPEGRHSRVRRVGRPPAGGRGAGAGAGEGNPRAWASPREGKKYFPRFGELSPELVRAGLAAAGVAEAAPPPVSFDIEPMARPPVLCAGLPAHGDLSGAARPRGAGRRRHRLLHARRRRAAALDRHHRLHGREHRQRRSAWRPPAKRSRSWRRSAIRPSCIRASRR